MILCNAASRQRAEASCVSHRRTRAVVSCSVVMVLSSDRLAAVNVVTLPPWLQRCTRSRAHGIRPAVSKGELQQLV